MEADAADARRRRRRPRRRALFSMIAAGLAALVGRRHHHHGVLDQEKEKDDVRGRDEGQVLPSLDQEGSINRSKPGRHFRHRVLIVVVRI